MSRRGQPDKHPQLLNFRSTPQSAADTDTHTTIPLPVPRFATGGATGVWCFEVLKIWFSFASQVAVPAGNGYHCVLATSPAVALVSDPRTIAHYEYLINTIAATPYQSPPEPVEYAFEDSGGKGLLVGTDNIYLYFGTANTGSANNVAHVRILYRLRRVSATEYIGIVQSQQ